MNFFYVQKWFQRCFKWTLDNGYYLFLKNGSIVDEPETGEPGTMYLWFTSEEQRKHKENYYSYSLRQLHLIH